MIFCCCILNKSVLLRRKQVRLLLLLGLSGAALHASVKRSDSCVDASQFVFGSAEGDGVDQSFRSPREGSFARSLSVSRRQKEFVGSRSDDDVFSSTCPPVSVLHHEGPLVGPFVLGSGIKSTGGSHGKQKGDDVQS